MRNSEKTMFVIFHIFLYEFVLKIRDFWLTNVVNYYRASFVKNYLKSLLYKQKNNRQHLWAIK